MENQSSVKNIVLGTLGFILISFVVQATSHFAINAAHYASIDFMREEPIMALGIFTMVLQGIVLSYLFGFFPKGPNVFTQGVKYGLLMGVFLGSYIALVEPSKYMAPSVIAWITTEGFASLIQFSLFGLILGFIYKSEKDPETA